MEELLFREDNFVTEIAFVGLCVALVMPAIMVHFSRNFFLKLIDSLAYRRETLFFSKLNINIPPVVFTFLTRMHQALLCGISLFLILHREHIPLPVIHAPLTDGILWVVALSLGCGILMGVHRQMSALWAYLYLSRAEQRQSTQYNKLLDLAWSCTLYPCLLALLSQAPTLYVYLAYGALLLLWRGVSLINRYRSMRKERVPRVCFFLYLCTHEIAPPLFLSTLIYSGSLVHL